MLSDVWNSGEVLQVPDEEPGRAGHEVLACACGAGVAGIGVLGLAGWAAGALALAGAAAAWIPAAPSTLAALVLLGAALILSAASRGRRAVLSAQWLAVPVLVMTAGVLLRAGVGSGAVHGAIPLGRMSPLTAAALALAGVAMLLRRRVPGTLTARVGGACAAGALAIGAVTALGYVHGIPLLYGGPIIPVSFPAALGLTLLGLGLLALDAPALAPLRAFLGDSVRARLLRGFVPTMVAIVVVTDVADTVLARRVVSNPAAWATFTALFTIAATAAVAAMLARRIGGDIDRAVAARKQAELALRASEERFRLLVEHLGEGAGVVDKDERFVLANPAAETLLGVEPHTLVGRSLLEFVVPGQSALVAAETSRRRAGEVSSYELDFIRPDGMPRRLHATVTPLPSPGGGYAGAIGVFRDVTSERQTEERLRQAQKMEAVGRLAGGIAHDFNNLLQAMGNLTALLAAGSADPVRAHALAAELSQEVQRGAGLARQLLLFSRQAATKRERLDLNAVLGHVAPLLRQLLPENVRLLLEPATSRLPVEADRNQIEQVLLNLATNGADAMPNGGPLAVRTGGDGDSVWLEVEDAGGGVPDEIRDKIFEPFFTTKGAEKGTGLGLAVVNGIVSEHGGRVELVTAPGAGATFRVVLPRPAVSPEDTPTRDAGGAPDGGRGERILVVEDEDGARASLSGVLAALGYQATAVASAEEVATLPALATYDLLLTDFRLPGATGADLARELQARWPALKVILMSGYTADEAVRQSVGTGVLRFLQKPFDMDTLARELRAALESSS